MTPYKTIRNKFFQNSVLLESRFSCPRALQRIIKWSSSSSSSSPETEETPEEIPNKRKVIRVAILGRPNAGKSTLINRILNKTVCDVSCKTHTTRTPLKTALTVGQTQIVFVDTPGVVTKQEYRKFDLSETFVEWKTQLFNELDMVGVIHEAQRLHETHNFRMKLIHCLSDLPETMPAFFIINKIDLVKDKDKLVMASQRLLSEKKAPKKESPEEKEEETEESEKPPRKVNLAKRFSKIFYISALENVGVGDVVNYLLEHAKEGEWMLPEGKYCDTSLRNLILNLTRAQFMDILPNILPYSLKFQMELLEENDLGQIACVVLAKCKRDSDKGYLLSRKLNRVKEIARKLESDLYNIFQKDFKITIVVTDKKGKA